MEMVVFRPHRHLLYESMDEKQEFNSIEEMKEFIINEHNSVSINTKFKITKEDIWLEDYGNDDRIGWRNTEIISFAPYNKISDTAGYLWWFDEKEEDIKYPDEPVGVIGFCSEDYDN